MSPVSDVEGATFGAGQVVTQKPPNERVHRSVRSKFLIIAPVPFARPATEVDSPIGAAQQFIQPDASMAFFS